MNEALKKTTKSDQQKKYMARKKMLCVCLDKEEDEDIIEWMSEQPCITNSVKRVLRYHINGRE